MDVMSMIQKLCASEMNLKGVINDDNITREICSTAEKMK